MYRLMVILALASLILFVTACGDDDDSGDMDASTDTDTDTDTDSDSDTDTDTDSDGDVGDMCQASYQGMMNFGGTCAAAETDCTAGVVPGDTNGTCAEGLTCCLAEDACEVDGAGMAECQDTECAVGLQAGCPNGGWCCVDLTGDAGAGSVADGGVCAVSIMSAVNMSGVCQPAGSTCEGGYFPSAEQGNCLASQNLHCCIDTDQCATASGGMLSCQTDPCTSMGFQVGCPANGYCCL